MQRRVAGAAVAIVAVLATVTAGCSSTTDGTATSLTSTSDAAAALWDPCTQIPDSALTAAQVDPSTKESGIGGVEQHGWKICKWKGSKYSISVYSTAKSPSEIANKAGNIQQQPVTIAGRQGTEFRSAGWDTQCNAVFATSQGAVQLQMLGRIAEDNPEDPCAMLARAGAALVPAFPK